MTDYVAGLRTIYLAGLRAIGRQRISVEVAALRRLANGRRIASMAMLQPAGHVIADRARRTSCRGTACAS